MLLPDSVYRRIPLIWMIMGVLFIVLAFTAGSDLRLVGVYVLVGFVSIGRSFWLFSARNSVTKHSKVVVLTETQKMERRTP
jgi:nicotinamide riboside transporter PnuC